MIKLPVPSYTENKVEDHNWKYLLWKILWLKDFGEWGNLNFAFDITFFEPLNMAYSFLWKEVTSLDGLVCGLWSDPDTLFFLYFFHLAWLVHHLFSTKHM